MKFAIGSCLTLALSCFAVLGFVFHFCAHGFKTGISGAESVMDWLSDV